MKMAEKTKDPPPDFADLQAKIKAMSAEDKEKCIEKLSRELQEELVVTSSLSNLVSEKDYEIEYLQNKVLEQEAKVRNLEDQVEEWTSQADTCDKLLEQKDCEIEMLRKTLNIEKQQRHDLEEMMMENSRESIREKEALEEIVRDLQARLLEVKNMEHLEEKLDCSGVDVATSTESVGDKETQSNANNQQEVAILEEEAPKQSPEMEQLMTDLFQLLKHNEELKEEIEKMKNEQVGVLESKRSVIKELESKLEEKSVENERHNQELRRLSSTIEVSEMEANLEKYTQMKAVREEYEGRIEELQFLASELDGKLNENEKEKEILCKQNANLRKKLQMEREQNSELNKQILEVSNLYDDYYTKYKEIKTKNGDQEMPIKTTKTQEHTASNADAKKELDATKDVVADAGAQNTSGIDAPTKSCISASDTNATGSQNVYEVLDTAGTEQASGGINRDAKVANKVSDSDANGASSTDQFDASSANAVVEEGEAAKNDQMTKKKQLKKKKKKKKTNGAAPEKIDRSKSDVILSALARVLKWFCLFSSIALIIFGTGYAYNMQMKSTLISIACLCLFIYYINKLLNLQRNSKDSNEANFTPHDCKLRRALQNAIVRLDDENFRQFNKIYESYISETFNATAKDFPYNSKDVVDFLKASNTVLKIELQNLKDKAQVTNCDYLNVKREIDLLRMKRLDEMEAKEKENSGLKQEIKRLGNELEQRRKEDHFSDSIENGPSKQKSRILFVKYLLLLTPMFLSCIFVDHEAAKLLIVILSVIYGWIMFRKDKSLETSEENTAGYQRTIRNLLRHTEELKIEEGNISTELKEMQSVVDKDFEIIGKQREAIERLERQLQRAIQKYQEKKKLTERFIWLRDHGIGSFDVLKNFDPKDTDFARTRREKDDYENTCSCAATSTGESKCSLTGLLMNATGRNAIAIAIVLLAGVIAATDERLVGFSHVLHTCIQSPTLLATMFFVMLTLMMYVKFYRSRQKKEQEGTIPNEVNADGKALSEQIDTLRSLLKIEREYVVKLESEMELNKDSSFRSIPKSEINAVIDKLIDVSKEKDELQVTADETKNKYDNVKRTLEDILSREKYLSEEVASLRTQKRELQNDLMKEQIRHIDMVEEVKKLRNERGDDEDRCNDGDEDLFQDDSDLDEKWQIESEDSETEIRRTKPAQKDTAKEKFSSISLERGRKDFASDSEKQQDDEKVVNKLKNDGKTIGKETPDGGYGDSINISAMQIRLNKMTNELAKEKLKNIDLTEEISKISTNQVIRGNGESTNDGETKLTNGHSNGLLPLLNEDKEEEADDHENGKYDRQQALLNAKNIQLQQLRDVLDFINDNRSHERKFTRRTNEDVEGFETSVSYLGYLEVDKQHREDVERELRSLGQEICKLKDICDCEVKQWVFENGSVELHSQIRHFAEQIGMFRYRISSDKAINIARINTLEEKIEELSRQMASLNSEVEKEKLSRNHVIKEYEDEYERLEGRLTEAYESIRKRLTEERSLRGQIMKQYEEEIEDIQNKTSEILKELQQQLKQERKEKEEAEHQSEMIMKKLKSLEMELELIEASSKAESDLDIFRSSENGKNDNNGNSRDKKIPDVEQFRKAVDEETSRRTRILKDELHKATKDINEFKNHLKEKELMIERLEKREASYKRKIDIQDKRMKDLEHEVRTGGTLDEDSTSNEGQFQYNGILGQLSTKNNTASWENPATTGIVQVTRSSAGFGNASDIFDAKPLPCSTEDLEDSWFNVDFGQNISVIPESYSLRHGWLSADGCLRSWVFEGSIDGNQWHLIKRHSMDTSLNERYANASWMVPETYRPVRYLRVRMTGRNSSNTNELYISGFEVSGKIMSST